ncbi:MAG TPA: 16S rRNA (adenine(1518)-N(6)/adenine(1519)-N(6))-dimethyltransferase RsmA [Clostridiales bacterium]|nr:16S rRNA (adenine(1518)-N(6)/adenine(1519)-N(6))-dimethyltransferase RsmA [Clostridiales bacterium]
MKQQKSSVTISRKKRPSNRFAFRKSLGQNFLRDSSVVAAIVEGALINSQDIVVEIGPGDGALTILLAERAQAVVALEIDERLTPILLAKFNSRPNVKILQGDIMKKQISDIIEEAGVCLAPGQRVKVLGNLPYYITTPLLMHLLEVSNRQKISTLTVMVQKEVADRIAAGPGSRVFGALSVAVQYHCRVEHLLDVSAEAFVPKPKVASAVLRLTILEQPSVKVSDEAAFFHTVRTAFGQRRKTLQNALAGIRGHGRESLTEAFAAAAIDPGRRAETLSLQEFANLTEAIIR